MFYEPFVGYVSKTHRLWKSKKINAKDLSRKDLFLLKEGHCFRYNVIQICERYGIKDKDEKIHFEAVKLTDLNPEELVSKAPPEE